MLRISCQKDSPIQVHQMESSKRNRHYGRMVLTQVHHGMEWWSTVQNSNIQQIYTLKVLTSTVVGSTHHLSHLLLTMALLHINKSCHKVLPLMVKVRRCLNLLEIPLLQVMLKNNLVRNLASLGNKCGLKQRRAYLYGYLEPSLWKLTVRSVTLFRFLIANTSDF